MASFDPTNAKVQQVAAWATLAGLRLTAQGGDVRECA